MRFEVNKHSDGGLSLHEFLQYMKTAKPGAYTLEVKKGRKRTLPQNALYWQRSQCIANYTGDTKEALHEYFMQQRGYVRPLSFKTGPLQLPVRMSSTELNTEQFSQLMAEQDELTRFLNEGKPPHEWLKLPTTETA